MREFDAPDDTALIWICAEPVVKSMRAKTFDEKSRIYGGISRGQRALFMFQVLRGHIGSGTEELFRSLSYLLGKEEVWRELKNAFLCFGDNAMAGLAGEMQQVYNELINGGGIVQKDRIRSFDERFFKLLPGTEKLAACYIRNHPEEFEAVTGRHTL